MSNITKVLAQLVWLDIFGKLKNPTRIDIKGWVANQGYSVNSGATKRQFELAAFIDSSYLVAALANDCNRMAMASIETICGISPETKLPRSGAWGLIRTYYAAFFAAHAILRMFGRSCSYLDLNYVNKFNEVSSVYLGNSECANISPGFYSIEIDRTFSRVKIRQLKDSHKDTWRELASLLSTVATQCTTNNNVTALSAQKIEAFDLVTQIKYGITGAGAGRILTSLSELRNSVNYQQSHRLWFPYGGKSPAISYIEKMSELSNLTLDSCSFPSGKDEVVNFFETSRALISLLLELVDECDRKFNGLNDIFNNGTLKLRNLVRI